MTVIAFLGSVFSPYYYAARNRRIETDPLDFTAFNVALYGKHAARWTFTERTARSLRRSSTELCIGASRIVAEQEGTIRLELDETSPLLKRRISGTVDIRFAHRHDAVFSLDRGKKHRWHPIAPRASFDVRLRSPSLCFTGSAYLDINWGDCPLEYDFREWSWSRHALSDQTAVFYDGMQADARPFSIGAAFDEAGRMREINEKPNTVHLPDTRIWRCPRTVRSEGIPRVLRTLENSPFYSRSLLETTVFGQKAPALHETLRLHCFTKKSMQRMLPFRIRREP